MKRTFSIQTLMCTAIAGSTAALLSAQTTTPQPPPQTPPAQQSSADTITVTGCLRSASSEPDLTGRTAGTTGTAGSTATGTTGAPNDPSQQKFVLMDATRSPADTPNASTAPPDSSAQAPKKDTYRLIANATALAQHVGKKLELTGTLDANAASQDTAPGPFAGRPMLRVTSGKIVGNTCDQQ